MPDTAMLIHQVEDHISELRRKEAELRKEADRIHRKGVMIRWASVGLAFAAVALSAVAGATGLGNIWSETTTAVLSLAAALVVAVNTAFTATSKAALTRSYKMLGSVLGYDARVKDRIHNSDDELITIDSSASPDDQEKRLVLLEHDTHVALDSASKFISKLQARNALDDLEAIEVAVRQ